MQRKEIKVGEAYAVTSPQVARQKRGSKQAVKATVVRTDAEHEVPVSRYSTRTFTAKDGIEVRFDKPVRFGWNGATYVARGVQDARTSFVFADGRAFLDTWGAYAAREAEFEKWRRKNAADAERAAARFESVLAEVIEKLRAMGVEGELEVLRDNSGGSFGPIDFTFSRSTNSKGESVATGFAYHAARLTSEGLSSLLGVNLKGIEDEDDDEDAEAAA